MSKQEHYSEPNKEKQTTISEVLILKTTDRQSSIIPILVQNIFIVNIYKRYVDLPLFFISISYYHVDSIKQVKISVIST